MNYFLRTVALAALAGLGYLGWSEYRAVMGGHEEQLAARQARIEALDEALSGREEELRQLEAELVLRDARVEALSADVARQQEQIDGLEVDLAASEEANLAMHAALSYLKIDQRRGRLTVVEQHVAEDGSGEVLTTVRFEELDAEGGVLGESVEAVLPGRFAYVESLVIKFDDDYVEQGDVWRGSSLCLFRRLFSESQRPEEGVPLDRVGEKPTPYADDVSPAFVDRLWARFWDYANDPGEAAAAGVRAIHGEAPFIEMRPGRSYMVELRASGGISLRAE